MAQQQTTWSTRVDQVTQLLAIGAGICLITLVAVVSLGVILRYVIGAPLLGINEIVQMVAVALAMLALPYCTSAGAHVRVDLFDTVIGRWGRFLGDIFSRCLSIVALSYLCRQGWKKASEAVEYGDVTNMIQLPLWPVYGAICVGMALCSFVFAVQILALILGWEADND